MLFWYIFMYSSNEDWAFIGVRKCQCEYSRGYSVQRYFPLLIKWLCYLPQALTYHELVTATFSGFLKKPRSRDQGCINKVWKCSWRLLALWSVGSMGVRCPHLPNCYYIKYNTPHKNCLHFPPSDSNIPDSLMITDAVGAIYLMIDVFTDI